MLINSWGSSRVNGYYFFIDMNVILFFVYDSRFAIDYRSSNAINAIICTLKMIHYLALQALYSVRNKGLLVLHRCVGVFFNIF